MLSREELHKAIRGPIQIINVPEWGGEIGVRRLTAADLVRLRELMPATNDGDTSASDSANLTIACELLAAGLCDNEGKSIFTAADLREWDSTQRAVRDRLIDVVQEHNGMGAAKVEGREKNSASGQTSDST